MSRQLRIYRLGSTLAATIPLSLLIVTAQAGGRIAARLRPSIVKGLAQNLARVTPHTVDAPLLRNSMASYGRYWAETFRVPRLKPVALDRGFSFVGLERIEDVRASGIGPIIVLPHIGGWEWAAAWLGRVAGMPVTAVVERLEPDDLFDWFVELRSSYNVNVVPLGVDAIGTLVRAVRERHVVCLVSDRDIAGNGVPVSFFGAMTTMPIGPAVLSIRTGSPLLPTAVVFRAHDRHCQLGYPLYAPEDGSLRERASALTQAYAAELERLIRETPEQWHVLSPLWPDDPEIHQVGS